MSHSNTKEEERRSQTRGERRLGIGDKVPYAFPTPLYLANYLPPSESLWIMDGTDLKQARPKGDLRAQVAFKDSMSRSILQFPSLIAVCYVLHRYGNRVIHRYKLYEFV